MCAISVVVITTGRDTVHRAVASAVASLAASGAAGEVLVVWQGVAPPPHLEGARVLHVMDVSVAHARNRGLDAARGDVVAYMDDDEVAAPDWVSVLLAAFLRQPRPKAVFGSVAPLDSIGIPYCVQQGDERQIVPRGRAPWVVGTGGNMAFDREVLLELGAFDLTFGPGAPGRTAEDSEVIWRALASGEVVLREPAAVVHHPSKTEAERLASRFPYGFGSGRLVRRHRDLWLAFRYVVMTLQSYVAGWRTGSPRRRREALGSLQGFLAGCLTRTAWRAPERVLPFAPPSLQHVVSRVERPGLPAGYRARPHFMYRHPQGLLHVYVGPEAELIETLALRARLRESGLPGVPAILTSGIGVDALWLLEQESPGTEPSASDVDDWWPLAVEWLALLAAAGEGGPLGLDPAWQDRVAAAEEVAQSGGLSIRSAADKLARLPCVVVHGDFQNKNLLVQGRTLSVIDWEYAHAAGVPGHDLLFLACTTRGEEVLHGLRAGTEPALADDLERVGLPRHLHAAAVQVAAADWALAERRHRKTAGTRPEGRRYYESLLAGLVRE